MVRIIGGECLLDPGGCIERHVSLGQQAAAEKPLTKGIAYRLVEMLLAER